MEPDREHGCQMALAGFLDRVCLALWASGLWLRYAALQNLTLHPGAIQGKEGIKFCYLATLIAELLPAPMPIRDTHFHACLIIRPPSKAPPPCHVSTLAFAKSRVRDI